MATMTSTSRFRATIAGAALCLASVLPGRAAIDIDASVVPRPPEPLPFAVGGRSPDGHVFSANTRYLTLDGRPWFPVMGEFHYARYPAGEWERELLKMKAGGINVVATYVFWIFHEETEGKFDWSGQRDLGKFVDLCARHGLLVWLRIGPWSHGEARNGGFPDWLVRSGAPLRENHPQYLEFVRRFYGAIGAQVKGRFWQDGGPIAGVQIENEYHPRAGGVEHMLRLRELAREAGMIAPFYTATGWDNAAVPPTEFLPVFGGYTEQFWSASLGELPPNQNFFFTAIRAEDNVMGDLTPKNPGYNSKYDGFPFLTAEMGGGMSIAYHRRPLMHADDSTAAALVKLGAGIAGLGYYMYHGGTNPDGLTSLQETQLAWNGYNDMEAKSYDFQAPLGEFGQVNATFRTLRALHLFLHDFGGDLAAMPTTFPAQMPKSRDDTATPRVAARTDAHRGFVFINNYQRNHPLGDKAGFQVALQLADGTARIPREPTTIPNGVYTHWPVNLDLGGATLRYATAELLCRLDEPRTFVFAAWPGLRADFAFAPGTDVSAQSGTVQRDAGAVFVENVAPATGAAIRVRGRDGAPVDIVVLPREQALQLAKAKFAGRERLALSPADVFFERNRVHATSRDAGNLRVAFFPALRRVPAGFRDAGGDGIFRRYEPTAQVAAASLEVGVAQEKTAEPSVPVKINPNPRRAVAMEPADADFDRAGVWRLKVPAAARTGRTFLRIAYEGDVARLYAGRRFDNDNFYKGTPWELAVWRFSPEELAAGLALKILPLRQDAPIYLAAGARPAFPASGEVARVKDVTLVQELEAVLTADE
jgi:hypothetical protein